MLFPRYDLKSEERLPDMPPIIMYNTILSLFCLLTSCDLCHITYGVNTANGVGMGGVYVAAEDESCMKENKEKISYYSSYNNHQKLVVVYGI